MKSSPQVSLSSAMKRSLLSFAALFLVVSALGGNVLAVPIAVDVYQDMETGNAGDVLTATMINSTSHPSSGWSTTAGTQFWVSTLYHRDLPGPVICGGVTYNGTGGSRSWTFNNNNQSNYVKYGFSGQPNLTVACYYTTLTTLATQVGYDTVTMYGTAFACLQTLAPGPYLRQHSSLLGGYASATGTNAFITPGHTYWLNEKYDASVGQVFVAVFDPDNGYAQLGSTAACMSIYNDAYSMAWFGRDDAHGNQTNETTYSYFDHIMFDWTNAAFPLLLCGPNDSTAPSAPPVVRGGTGPDQDQSIAMSSTQLSANWDMAWDAQSGIKAYQYAIGTTKGGTDVTNWTTLKCQFGVTKTGLSLTNGQTYYFAVRAINGVGLTGPITNSNGQTYGPTDTTAPGAPAAVRDGWYIYGPDADETDDNHDLFANYDGASDQESGISFYQYAIGTTPGGNDTVNWTTLPAVGLCREVCATNLNSPNGLAPGRYYTSVRAINNAGITGPAMSSNGIVARNTSDTTPPGAPPVVRDGTGADISTQTSTTQLSANWDNGSDPESGIRCYYYKIGTTPGGTQVVNETQTGYDSPVGHVTVTGLSLSVGQTYYVGVKSVNGNWASSSYTNSNGVTIVSGGGNQAPSAPANVRDGVGADITYTTSNTQLSANWDASTDPDGSVTAYQYAIGTSAGGTQTLNWTTLGNVTTVTKTGLSLTSGQTYYFSVKAVDNLGLAGNATNSNGQTVDTTAPSAPANVRDGTGADISTTNSTTQLSANWDASADAESGINGYQYAIGTTAGGTQTVNWTSLGNVTTVTKTGLTLTNGQTYFFSVKAVDGAGLTGNATNSNGQTVQTTDVTPPSAPANVRDGVGVDISTTSSTTQLSANWDAATDAESGISGYQYAIGTTAGGTQTVNWTSLGNVTTVTRTGLTLSVGQTYYFSVQAINGAGLTGSATNSNGQTVVTASNIVYFSDNFESWTVHGGAWTSTSHESSTHTLDTSTDYAKAGGKSLKLTDTDTTGLSYGAFLLKNFSPVISGDIYVRYFVFLPTGYGSANVGCGRRIVRIWCGTNRGEMTINTTAGGNYPSMEEIGGWGGVQSSTTLTENVWHCLEIHMATPSASTLMEFWIDGVKNAATLNGSFAASTTYTYIEFGDVVLNSSGSNGNGTFYMDELVVSNYYNGTSAMTTYFQDNFENWTVHGGAWTSTSGETATQTLNTSTDYARAGTKSLKLTDSDTTNSYGACLVKTFSPTIASGIYVRFYVYLPTGYTSTNSGAASRRLLWVVCGSNRAQMSLQNGAHPMIEEIGAWTYSLSSSNLTENAWHCIELYMATPSASTAMQYWIDGTSAGTLTGSFSSSTAYDHIYFGDVSVGGGTNVTGTFYVDEFIASDTYNGPLP